MRLDLYLTKNGICESRNKAAALIADGKILVNEKRITKASFSVADCDKIDVISDEKLYVARSANKLLTAIDKFGLELKDKTVVDLGASTGGFCEVMLDYGVKKIYAVDIGTNQLHPKIKSDPRIINMEHTNARFVTASDFQDKIDLVTCDLSFISLKLVLNAVMCTLADGGIFVGLVKPQFEVGSCNLGKNGVVKDLKLHALAIKNVSDYACQIGFEVVDVCFSGLAGESGNKEYLLYMKKSGKSDNLIYDKINCAVLGGE